MKNRTKDTIAIIIFLFIAVCVALILSVSFYFGFNFIANLNAETITTELTEQQQINKFYTEERIKAEMYYLSAWETVENMSEEEFENTFYISWKREIELELNLQSSTVGDATEKHQLSSYS